MVESEVEDVEVTMQAEMKDSEYIAISFTYTMHGFCSSRGGPFVSKLV